MSFTLSEREDTIIALATPQGVGAIAVIRISGKDAIRVCNEVFFGKNLEEQPSHTIHLGTIRDGEKIIDEVLVSLFKGPRSFTKENVVEISTHGSSYIVNQVLKLFVRKGVRLAKPGEFTQRAFLNGQFDLAQAEAVADLIHSDSESSHQAALNQMRGGFSSEIQELRNQLIHFASMIELELDFSEEDVEFVSREGLRQLVERILRLVEELILSFDLGNVIKNGVPTVIAGKPNAGKSTLLNALLNEEKAIVSDIAGTTRDFIEDELSLGGVIFRFIDTAGLRRKGRVFEAIEKFSVVKTLQAIESANVVLLLLDATQGVTDQDAHIAGFVLESGRAVVLAINKWDAVDAYQRELVHRSIEARLAFLKFDSTALLLLYLRCSWFHTCSNLQSYLLLLDGL